MPTLFHSDIIETVQHALMYQLRLWDHLKLLERQLLIEEDDKACNELVEMIRYVASGLDDPNDQSTQQAIAEASQHMQPDLVALMARSLTKNQYQKP